MADHLCAVRGCPHRIARVKLMCRGHWARVPGELRHRIWEAYRAWQHSPGDRELLDALTHVQQAAVRAVEEAVGHGR